MALKNEIERRISMGNTEEFAKLPYIVCIIDEFPSLNSNTNGKSESKVLSETISSLLRRGRHTKIHMVIAAQDPTIKNMKCELGNITAHIAFICAKPQLQV